MNDLEELRGRARNAAPAKPEGEHLAEAVLAAIRADGDDESLDDAYRHLASCAACRARLVESNVTPIDRNRWQRFAWIAAAAVVFFAAAALLRKAERPRLDVEQRSYAGTMGSVEDAGPIAPADMNLELSFAAVRAEAATLLVVDRDGKRLAPPRPFTREGEKMRAVVAPRTFAAHTAPTFGFVIAGSESAAHAALDDALRLPAITEGELTTIASRHNAIVAKLTIAQ